ncbi:MAG: phosphotransferase [Candidatus Pacebacteria bacterium]|nr:phosphotransferase [Candidatus Paceibacterota bacterium]
MINKVDPQNQIRLNKEIVSKLVSPYGLDLISFEEVASAGVKNTSAFLNTNRGRFVLKVYRRNNKKLREISQEILFANFLREHGIPIPQTLSNPKGEFVCQKKIDNLTWTYILMEFVEGEYLEHDQYDLMPLMAKYQALMHGVTHVFKMTGKVRTLADEINDFVRYDRNAEEFLKENHYYPRIRELISSTILYLRNNFNEIRHLPSGLVHMDYESDNILVDKKKITAILDFDDLSYHPFVADIGISLWWWLFMNRDKDCKSLIVKYLKEYQKYRKLSAEEIGFLPLFIQMRNINVLMYDLSSKRSKKEWKELLDFSEVLTMIKTLV